MSNQLSATELKLLIQSVFSPTAADHALGLLIDVPDDLRPDHAAWRARREMASAWARQLSTVKDEMGLERTDAIFYPNVRNNNADLPETAYLYDGDVRTVNAHSLMREGQPIAFRRILEQYSIFLAPTEFSATAPMKLSAPKYNFRAATMPGFTADMLPALRLDYAEINRRVGKLKALLDPAQSLDIQFTVDGRDRCSMHFDLRHRQAHASGGRFPTNGVAGNLPGGECYIVPYEGEQDALSETSGTLPIQLEGEIIRYRIAHNRAVEVLSRGKIAQEEAIKIAREPAYANLAEIGFGVLRDFGVKPIRELLLDEKLGLHIAFGRSDHFGGAVGAKDFSAPEKVEHTDRIFIPELQDRIHVDFVQLVIPEASPVLLFEDGSYRIF